MTDLERYVLQEHVEDFNDGLISRRELLRRVTLITGSLGLTLVALEAAGCASQPAASPPSPSGRAQSSPQPYATPPAAGTADGITVRPDDPRIRVVGAAVKGPDGAPLTGYMARPAGTAANPPGVLVVHQNTGLKEHIKDVVRRLATAGFSGLAVVLLSRSGGA